MDFSSRYALDSARSRLKKDENNTDVLFELIENLFAEINSLRGDLSKAERKIEDLMRHTFITP